MLSFKVLTFGWADHLPLTAERICLGSTAVIHRCPGKYALRAGPDEIADIDVGQVRSYKSSNGRNGFEQSLNDHVGLPGLVRKRPSLSSDH